MAVLSMRARRAMSPDDYVFPDKAPGHGSYPIPDRGHAEDALMLAKGKPEEREVREKVCAKYQIGCGGTQ